MARKKSYPIPRIATEVRALLAYKPSLTRTYLWDVEFDNVANSLKRSHGAAAAAGFRKSPDGKFYLDSVELVRKSQ